MNSKNPKISVGMPVYNGETYLELAIKATLDQTFTDFELIISDNASTDRTEEICRDYATKDSRILYLRNSENIGAAKNYNQLFHKSSGQYFRWFNADDLCSNALHERCLEVMEANPGVVMCYGKTDIIDGQGHLIKHYDDNLDLQHESVFDRFNTYFNVVGLTNAIYGLIRKSALGKTILMGDGSFPAADTNLMGELTLYGKFMEIPETLFYRRMHEEASSWDRKDDSIQQKFWTGNDAKFVLPTFKKYRAYLKAIRESPNTPRDKMRMQKYILRRMVWVRGNIFRETCQAVAGKFIPNG